MRPEIVVVDPAHPERAFARCREVVISGGVIAYPTDTFYGIGADPRNQAALRRIFAVKNRPAGQPLLLLLHSLREVSDWAVETTDVAADMMDRFWPGPLTLIFQARETVLRELTGNTGTIGLRVPGNDLTRGLLAVAGSALTGTSANVTGCASLRTAQDVASALGEKVDLILDGGATVGDKPSTIVDVSGKMAVIIREGAVPTRKLFSKMHTPF